MSAGGGSNDREIYEALKRNETVGVAISANALAAVKEESLVASLGRTGGRSIPLLIFGVGPETDPTTVKEWTGGIVSGGLRQRSTSEPHLHFGRLDGFRYE